MTDAQLHTLHELIRVHECDGRDNCANCALARAIRDELTGRAKPSGRVRRTDRRTRCPRCSHLMIWWRDDRFIH